MSTVIIFRGGPVCLFACSLVCSLMFSPTATSTYQRAVPPDYPPHLNPAFISDTNCRGCVRITLVARDFSALKQNKVPGFAGQSMFGVVAVVVYFVLSVVSLDQSS